MNKKVKWLISGVVSIAAVIIIVAFVYPTSGGPGHDDAQFGVATARAAEPIGHIGAGKAAEAIEKAGNSGKYVFALFYREENEQTMKARDLIDGARKKISRKSEIVEINVTDPSEQDVVNKFGTSRAPMPLVLMLAPNGAIMTGAPAARLDENKLVDAVGTKGSEQVIKALQEKNMVALCVQNRKTKDNSDAMRGVREFTKDPKYGPTTAIVTMDPSDPAEAKFLSRLNIDANSGTATTALLAPPGAVIGTFQGATTMDQLVASVQAAAKPKAGGCCPPGSGKTCGPTGGVAAPQKAPARTQLMTAQPQVPVKQVTTKSATPPSTAAASPSAKATEPTTKQGK